MRKPDASANMVCRWEEEISMRRITSITMVVLFVISFVTGLAESHVHPGESGIHTPFAVAFGAVTIVHVILNLKPLARYFRGQPKKLQAN